MVSKENAELESKMLSVKSLTDNLDVAFGTSGVRGLVKDLTPAICFCKSSFTGERFSIKANSLRDLSSA
ncbi:MAG: hypothetical protein ACI9YE_000956 [Psychroserpens sp.]|jgi:hypothetical protein